MSYNAKVWARRQTLNDSTLKHLLKTYADWAGEDYTTWVSVDELQRDTELNPKTITSGTTKLVKAGFLRDTGERAGKTRQIIVYQMTAPADSEIVQVVNRRTSVVETLSPPDLEAYEEAQKRKDSKIGGVKGDQKRKPSKNGSLPNPAGKTPKNGSKDPQILPERPPKTVDDKGLRLQEEGESGFARDDETEEPPAQPSGDESPTTKPCRFDQFWDVWPSKSGRKQAREVCKSHWDANGLDDKAPVIIAHVQAMKLSQHWKTGGDPTPITYLEQRRWLDGAPQAERAPEETADWWLTPDGVERERIAEGLPVVKEERHEVKLARVARSKGRGPWIDHVLALASRIGPHFRDQTVAFLGEKLMPTDWYAS